MRIKTQYLVFVGLLTTVFLLVIILQQNHTIQELKNSQNNLSSGKKIAYFELLALDQKKTNSLKVDQHHLNDKKASLIFIFQRPCSPCNKNITVWEKIAGIFADKLNIYGVIVDDYAQSITEASKLHVNFNMYAPENLQDFKKELNLSSEQPHTIFYQNQIQYVKSGNLSGHDVLSLIQLINEKVG